MLGFSTSTLTTASAPTSTTTRSSRLRGISRLRTYTSPRPEHAALLKRSISSPVTSTPTIAVVAAGGGGGGSSSSNTGSDDSSNDNSTPAPSATLQSGHNGWIPTIHGRSVFDRASSTSAALQQSSNAAGMTRSRAATAVGPTPSPALARRQSAGDSLAAMDALSTPAPPASTRGDSQMPTIRFIPHVETRSSRPSLHFPAVSRTLSTPTSTVRVGRFSERDNHSGDQNLQPVGFKSKVVSRRHCEFWCTDGQWYIKDVKSSSGTFLNHVRLSSPGNESRPWPVNDGDVVQLGIDFKGGEEVIFRCVKIRVECNRGWQKSLNTFNTSAHKRLFNNSIKSKAPRDSSDAASINSSSECSICLNPVAPCQALFVAPCSHVWHYKCIRNLLFGANFLCPNCRANADLDADVEQPDDEGELWEDDVLDDDQLQAAITNHVTDPLSAPDTNGSTSHFRPEPNGASSASAQPNAMVTDEELAGLMSDASLDAPTAAAQPDRRSGDGSGGVSAAPSAQSSSAPPAATSGSLPIPIAASPTAALSVATASADHPLAARSATPTTNAPYSLASGVLTDALMTPRNDAGPFVLDGGAGRRPDALPELGETDSIT